MLLIPSLKISLGKLELKLRNYEHGTDLGHLNVELRLNVNNQTVEKCLMNRMLA